MPIKFGQQQPPGFSGGGLVARSLFGMGWSLAIAVAKLKRCHRLPMPGTAMTNVEMTCLQGLADLERLERLEGLWVETVTTGDPESVATALRLLLAHLTVQSDRLNKAMVLDRLDAVTAPKEVS